MALGILRPMIVDAHTHVFPPEVQRDRGPWLERDRGFAAIYGHERARIATADDLLRSMDRAGVERSVICGFGYADLDLCRRANDSLMEAAARAPDRLTGFGMAPPGAGGAGLDEVRRCAEGGLRGIGELRPDDQGVFGLPPETLDAYFGALRDNGMLLLSHASEPAGHRYPGKGTATPERLLPLLERASGLNVVLAHWGGGLPFYALMPEVRRLMASVYVDTAASHFLYEPQVYRTVAALIGAERILFASDFPLAPQTRALRLAAEAGLSETDMALIMGGNALRLLGG
ncbi:MAG: amidohydrolase family protein [Chloroflexi bacterium]|nr:amidohydrolase family protein [Chloroflexota bacterium]